MQQASDSITGLLAGQEAVDVLRDHHLLMGHDLEWDKRSSEEGSGQTRHLHTKADNSWQLPNYLPTISAASRGSMMRKVVPAPTTDL